MGIPEGVYAWKERTGESRYGQPDLERTGARLHNSVELRHRRNMDPPCSEHQGRIQYDTSKRMRSCTGEGQSYVYGDIPADGAVLGQSARHLGSCLCGSLCADALCIGTVYRQGQHQVGFACCYCAQHHALMGT